MTGTSHQAQLFLLSWGLSSPGQPGTLILPISASYIAWDDKSSHCTQLLVGMGLMNFFAQADLKL
jgi:hypothetical protein